MPLSTKIISFLKTLELTISLPRDVKVMNPFKEKETLEICEKFYNKYYNDDNSRIIILGINPGRFGGGLTGIPFTDPIRLQHVCGIENSLLKKQELSSAFIYEMISAFGGAEKFYSTYYISSTIPLGFTKHNKNMNYYDDKKLEASLESFVIDCMNKQLQLGVRRDVAYCFGEGKNFLYLDKLNKEQKFFDTIIPLPHPRFIMQYKLKKKDEYIHLYLHHLQHPGSKP